MWLSILIGAAVVVFVGFCIWRIFKIDRDRGRCAINDTLNEIAGDEVMSSVVRLMTKNNDMSIDEIVKMTGSELAAKIIIDRLQNIGVMLDMFPLHVPVACQQGSKLYIVPRWLKVFQELEKWNWDSSRVYEVRF